MAERTITKSYESNQVLLDWGELPRRVYFIKSGGALAYRKHLEDNILVRIWQEGDLILHIEQGWALRRNNMRIITAADTTTLELDSREVQQLREDFPQMRYYFDQFTAEEIRYWQDRSFQFQISDFKQLHYDSLNQHGELYEKLTLKNKASYIGSSERWIRDLK